MTVEIALARPLRGGPPAPTGCWAASATCLLLLASCGRSGYVGETDEISLLGCDEDQCYTASNLAADNDEGAYLDSFLSGELGSLTVTTDAVVDTDSGAITTADDDLRAAGSDLDPATQTAFIARSQVAGPELAILLVRDLTIEDGVVVDLTGARSLVVLATGRVIIDGIVDGGARGATGGPGGYDGGAPDANGHGPGAGQQGEGTLALCVRECVSGGGGGGHGAPGGPGGDVEQIGNVLFYAGGGAGYTCGTDQLVPLVGGSGGSGGVTAPGYVGSAVGAGGGGGGAIQITALDRITVGPNGGITVPGDGGGETVSGAGAGGGAGGAILLEAPVVQIEGFLAANGGGGSGGDCT